MYQPSGIDIHLHIPTPSFTVITYTIVTMKNCMALAIALTVATLLFLNLSSGGGAYYYNRLTDEFKEVILDRSQMRSLRRNARPHPDDYTEIINNKAYCVFTDKLEGNHIAF